MNCRSRYQQLILAGMLLSVASASAQTVQWTTNYYPVTGANFRDIRRSIATMRPWKDPFDGDTRWNISWNFTSSGSAAGCSAISVSTNTKITTTMPRWTPPTDVAPETKERWTRYYTNLLQHETGHARIALAAAAEVRQRLSTVGTQPNCETLKTVINQRAEKVVDDYRAREKEYDRRTNHGNNPAGIP